ncbi:hypothetical protein [Stratiformator vulcanicus]|uniref:Uncharacterized protein n=1 Tax=Stratiformator vulcanicus TaxID=2527980 RepID=A0A517R793_9PLAN|nr:hypothetical protein [Stratiformator vulcanicus]QDT39722.1 hypothetical protein Pan189_41310 [Stratiformator vulcanicus]
MAINVVAGWSGRRISFGPDGTYERYYTVTGSESEVDVAAALDAAVPDVFGGALLQKVDVEWMARGTWGATASYGTVKPREKQPARDYGSTTPDISIDIGTTTVKRHVSHATVNTYAAPGETAPDFNGLIGVDEEGEAEGVDVPVATPVYKESHIFNVSTIPSGYYRTLSLIASEAPVNDAPFKGFELGELKFVGASFQSRNNAEVAGTFNFEVSYNATNLTVGSITGITKSGHDYLWVYRGKKTKDATSGRMVSQPVAAYVERVFLRSDFAALGIGT